MAACSAALALLGGVIGAGFATVPMLQREIKLGHSRAVRIMDQLEECGIVGPYNEGQPREIVFRP